MDFFHSGRKFFFTSSVNNMYICTKTYCCSCCIHRNITAADDSYFRACNDWCVIRIIKCFHQITSCQILICRKYAVRIFPWNSHKFRKSSSGSDKYCLESFFFNQLINCRRFTDYNVCLKFYAEFFYFFDLFCHNFMFWKTKFRNTIHKNASKFM